MKKVIFITIGILVLAAAAGGVFYFEHSEKQGSPYFKFYQKFSSNLVNPLTSQTGSSVKLAVWEDPAGFKFSYPQEIEINNHPEDEENYAHLELTVGSHSGSILIWVKDTTYKEIEDWVKKEAFPSTSSGQAGSAQVFDSELGGNPAKKIAFNNPQKLVTATLDGNAIVLIEVYPEDQWWNETYNQILSSFEFIPLASENKTTTKPISGSSGGIIDEGEEIIE